MKLNIIQYRHLFFLTAGLISILVSSCIKEGEPNILINTEQTLLISSDEARLSGRVLSNQNIKVEDHGFEIALNESMNSPIVESLGALDGPGFFISDISQLTPETTYFYRAWALIDGVILYGEVTSFSTNTIQLINFTPKLNYENSIVTISGYNFPEDVVVKFGESTAEIFRRTGDSEIRVRVPAIIDSYQVPISVTHKDQTISFQENFEYITGTWTVLSESFPSNKIKNAVSLIGSEIPYLGFGYNNGTFPELIWKLNTIDYSWEEMPHSPARMNAFYAENYFGGGQSGNPPPFGVPPIEADFWKLENGLFQQLESLPEGLVSNIAFKDGDFIYVLGGLNDLERHNLKIYQYSIIDNSWSIYDYMTFYIDSNRPYAFFNGLLYVLNDDGDLLTYSPSSKNWNYISSYPSGPGNGGIGFVYDNLVYMGFNENTRVLYAYDPIIDEWKIKNTLELPRVISAVGKWVVNNEVLILYRDPTNFQSTVNLMRFEPYNF